MSTRYAIKYIKKDGSPSSHTGTIEKESETHVTLAVDAGGFRSFLRSGILSMTRLPTMFDVVHCSQCGGEFHVKQDSGFSHCHDHADLHNFD